MAWQIAQLELRDSELARRDGELAKLDESLAHRDATIKALELKNQKLTHGLAYYRRIRLGAKTEAMSAEQLHLFEDDLAEDIAAVEAELSPPADAPPKPRPKAGRQPLPDHLPRETHVHEPDSCPCGQCGAHLVKIGEDVTEKLNIIPARFFVERHVYPTRLPIDNPVLFAGIENAIRPIAPGKKIWLFAGSERAGKRAAAIQSLFATAKLNDIEPAAWLKDTLEKLHTWPNSRIDELLPFRQKA
ncbi:transposase domain-containing protein [Halothiobacillus sp. 15-55-196]|uniref:transposase domain-containing protein n=1 Tax=Halothiobacillus sp. 15-55-196 TaxID=1970382 RepID=UPI0025B80262|nr:transposase domain-containing protein [Halothiobacillus sp. 15-55-196]